MLPNGSKGWIYGHLTTDKKDLDQAYESFKKSGIEDWDDISLMVWYSVKGDLNKLDKCSLKLVYKAEFNRKTEWPAYCNSFENTDEVQGRVKVLSDMLLELSPSDEEREKLARGKVWIGAKEDFVTLAWGSPVKVNRTVTANRVKEQWVYGSGNYVYVTNGLVTGIQN